MFSKVLVANRGEIALRVIRALRELGIKSVAIYSEADRDALHVWAADEAFCVGPGPSARSYLHIPNIISSAVLAGVDAIHPGYGYLAERADFAEICETHGIKFIGPPPAAIEKMGDKVQARRAAADAGVPVIPGSLDPVEDDDEAVALAAEIGYPVMIKAAAGGGGKGMRVARDQAELLRVLEPARAEAQAAFGSGALYIEKLIEAPRHVEIQVLADERGNIIHLGERECSVQRRHQKVVEEAPSPAVSSRLRKAMGEAAVRVAEAVGYTNAGTVEFLLDAKGNFYFLEMNTRIQVEHPVTECVTGIDLVKAQIAVAAGEPLPYSQQKVRIHGHAIECRINAEDPARGFLPSPGKIHYYHAPGGFGIRVDSGVGAGSTVPPYYDSLLAKLIVHGTDREEAVAKALSALAEFRIEGVATNIGFLRELLAHPQFQAGELSTDFIEKHMS
ncbi:MAG: acetyl-CoA carboxylase biotin carboxylase subunit [Firmicutes bacterium]|nr:acetyl-CoA carboxylase biotin carboxylase subunit [Bacillota bacterium]MBO2520689.1 acetyl-CoA carboxylase biotin carboxylase subunit [Bacillota bacterium]